MTALLGAAAPQYEKAKQKKQLEQQLIASRPQRRVAMLTALEAELGEAAEVQATPGLQQRLAAAVAAAAAAAGISDAAAAQQEEYRQQQENVEPAAATDANGHADQQQHDTRLGFVDAQQQAVMDDGTTAAAAVQLLRPDHQQQQEPQQQDAHKDHPAELQPDLHHQQQLDHHTQQPGHQQQESADAAAAAEAHWGEPDQQLPGGFPASRVASEELSRLGSDVSHGSQLTDDYAHQQLHQEQPEWVPWAAYAKLQAKLERAKVQFFEMKAAHQKGRDTNKELKAQLAASKQQVGSCGQPAAVAVLWQRRDWVGGTACSMHWMECLGSVLCVNDMLSAGGMAVGAVECCRGFLYSAVGSEYDGWHQPWGHTHTSGGSPV